MQKRGSASENKTETANAARALARSRRVGMLATALASDDSRPYASLVTYACDTDASPIFLFSTLADHTRNLAADARASLLIEDAGRRANPQTGPRLTLVGRIAPDEEPRLRRRFLALNPGAAMYAEFGDFRIYRMAIERAHWVGGFAQARWLESAAVLSAAAAAAAIGEVEPGAIAHMNTAHGETIGLYARQLLRRAGSGWRIVALDPDGCDLVRRATTFARLSFPQPVTDSTSLREAFLALAATARSGAAAS